MRKIVFTLLAVVGILSLFCEERNKSEFAVFPQFAYSQETGFWGGLITYYRYELLPDTGQKNHLDLLTMYTQKKQLQIRFIPKFHFTNLNSDLKLNATFMKWPSEFYGIDNSNSQAERFKFTPEISELEIDWIYYLSSLMKLHCYSDILHSVIIKREEPLLMKDVPGNEKYFISGLGLGISYDGRDAEDFPTQGIFTHCKLLSYRSWLGSDYDYEEITIDVREYLRLSNLHVLAFQQFFSYKSDQSPFYKLFKLGEYVRSYNDELFLNNHGLVFRAEYRFFPFKGKIGKRLGFATFIDLGQGMQRLQELNFSDWRCSYGIGLRISIFVKDRFNLRFDYGSCKADSAFEISGGETF